MIQDLKPLLIHFSLFGKSFSFQKGNERNPQKKSSGQVWGL